MAAGSRPSFIDAEYADDGGATADVSTTYVVPAETSRRQYRGRASSPLPLYVRDLTAEDFAIDAGQPASPRDRIKVIRERHHAAAQMVAAGDQLVTVSRVTGLSVATIRLYVNDPAFKELVAGYRATLAEKFDALGEQMAGLMGDSMEALRDRIRSNPTELAAKDLLQITAEMADRLGRGPTSKSVSVNVNTNVDTQEQLRARIAAERKGRVKVEGA